MTFKPVGESNTTIQVNGSNEGTWTQSDDSTYSITTVAKDTISESNFRDEPDIEDDVIYTLYNGLNGSIPSQFNNVTVTHDVYARNNLTNSETGKGVIYVNGSSVESGFDDVTWTSTGSGWFNDSIEMSNLGWGGGSRRTFYISVEHTIEIPVSVNSVSRS